MTSVLFYSIVLCAQTFGQNKIQYKNFDFNVLSTEHFDIYFSQGGTDLAAFSSLGGDLETDIFMRDLIINNNVVRLSELSSYRSGYIRCKEGQALINNILLLRHSMKRNKEHSRHRVSL